MGDENFYFNGLLVQPHEIPRLQTIVSCRVCKARRFKKTPYSRLAHQSYQLLRQRLINLPCFLGSFPSGHDFSTIAASSSFRYFVWERIATCNDLLGCSTFMISFVANIQVAHFMIPRDFARSIRESTFMSSTTSLLENNHFLMFEVERAILRLSMLFYSKLIKKRKLTNNVYIFELLKVTAESLLPYNRMKPPSSNSPTSLYDRCLHYVNSLYYTQLSRFVGEMDLPHLIFSDLNKLNRNAVGTSTISTSVQ